MLFAEGSYEESVDKMRKALSQNPDLDGGYYLLGRALFAAGRIQEVVDMMEEAMVHSSENYNTTVPIHNALGALGKKEALNNSHIAKSPSYEEQIKKVPEDARARVLLAGKYAMQGRFEEAKREVDMAMILRPDDSMILYNAACLLWDEQYRRSANRNQESMGVWLPGCDVDPPGSRPRNASR